MKLDDECYECLVTTSNANVPSRPKSTRKECRSGHEFTEDNTAWTFRKEKYVRYCKTCERISYKKYFASKGSQLKKERYDESKQG